MIGSMVEDSNAIFIPLAETGLRLFASRMHDPLIFLASVSSTSLKKIHCCNIDPVRVRIECERRLTGNNAEKRKKDLEGSECCLSLRPALKKRIVL